MTFTEAAAEVLRLVGKPLHYKEITELAIEKSLLSHVGKSPEVTMGARLAALLKKDDKENPIVRVRPGVFALRDWNEKKGRKKDKAVEPVPADEPSGVALEPATDDNSATDVNALLVEQVEAQAREPELTLADPAAQAASSEGVTSELRAADPSPDAAAPVQLSLTVQSSPRNLELDDDEPEESFMSGEDARRADLAASGADLFDDEDDDDQPILAPLAQDAASADPNRRRRRRRRRGRGGDERERSSSPRVDLSSPGPVAGDGDAGDAARDPLAPAPRPMIRERQQIMAGGGPTGIDVPAGEGEELSGRELADAAFAILSTFDRNAGPLPIRSVVDQLMRRGRLSGDPALATVQVSASMRADNLRRQAAAQRPRFRFASSGRVALTDWLLGSDLARLEADVLAAIERYRDAARRALLRRLQDLPGHALVEVVLLALEKAGFSQIKAVRRQGAPGGESHFSAVMRAAGDDVRVAIVLRKDGREIGRERVTDLRGALHHYGAASAGWVITTGQVLSGARDESQSVGAAPISLVDGLLLCKLLEEQEVAVLRTRHPVFIPDLEMLESLRG